MSDKQLGLLMLAVFVTVVYVVLKKIHDVWREQQDDDQRR